jgi:hypothetical protein
MIEMRQPSVASAFKMRYFVMFVRLLCFAELVCFPFLTILQIAGADPTKRFLYNNSSFNVTEFATARSQEEQWKQAVRLVEVCVLVCVRFF